MKPTKEHFRKKKQNLIITAILLILQIVIIGFSVYLLGGLVNIYGNIAFIFFILGIPNLVFISTNIIMLLRGEWIRLRFSLDKIYFIDNPQKFLENTFPTASIVLISLAVLLSLYFFMR